MLHKGMGRHTSCTKCARPPLHQRQAASLFLTLSSRHWFGSSGAKVVLVDLKRRSGSIHVTYLSLQFVAWPLLGHSPLRRDAAGLTGTHSLLKNNTNLGELPGPIRNAWWGGPKNPSRPFSGSRMYCSPIRQDSSFL